MNDAAPSSERETIEIPVRFVDAISATTTIEETLDTGARWLSKIIGCMRCSIAYLDNGQLIALEFRSDGRFTAVPNQTVADETTCRGRVLKTGLPVFLDRAGIQKAGGPVFQRLLSIGINSILIAPMFSSGKVIGTMAACRTTTTGFSTQESRDLITVGKWIAAQVRLMKQVSSAQQLAETDNLTGLANRVYLMDRLEAPDALTPDPQTGHQAAILTIDLDHFKTVNDSQGHTAGDAMLVAAAQAMRDVTGPDDVLARTGGDEFQILTRTDPQGRHLASLACKLIKIISHTVDIDGVPTRVGASIGTAIADSPDCTPDRLIGNSDLALYEVKRAGRGCVRSYAPAMRKRHDTTRRMMADLQDAADRHGFEPYFQPQVCLATGKVTGVEILARWPHPTLGVLGPDDFMDLAIEGHLLDQIDEVVRFKGLSALRDLRGEGWTVPRMAFNASAAALRDPGLGDALLREVRDHGLDPSDLTLEVREASLIESTDGAVGRNVANLAKAGFHIALDDFGTGCAAISNLTTPGISAIKLDRTLVSRLPDTGGETILRAIINLAHELDLTVTAGGVETPVQHAMLRALGCSSAQGYGVAPPMPLADLLKFLTGYGQAPAIMTG